MEFKITGNPMTLDLLNTTGTTTMRFAPPPPEPMYVGAYWIGTTGFFLEQKPPFAHRFLMRLLLGLEKIVTYRRIA